jgi:site-specific recombinase XerD
MRDFESALLEYRLDLQYLRRAPGTIRNYLHSLRLWSEWLDRQDDPPETVADVKKSHVQGWILACQEKEAPETVLTRHRHLRAFFRWAERQESPLIEKNPMATLSEPEVAEQPPEVLTRDQLKAIFATTKADKSRLGRRDYALMALLVDSGIRVGELVSMELDDIDFENGSVTVFRKGGSRGTAAFSAATGKALLAYLRERATRSGAVGTDRVWIGQRGPLQEAAVWQIVKARGEDAGVKGVYPHLFRHTWSHMYRLNGGSEESHRRLGGWSARSIMPARYGASAATSRAIAENRRVDHLKGVL